MKTLKQAEAEARTKVNNWTIVAASVGWVPFSQFFLAPADYKMVEEVANCFEVTDFNAAAVLTAAGATVAGKMLFSTVLDFFPPAWIAKSAVAAGVTKTVGEFVINHFKSASVLANG